MFSCNPYYLDYHSEINNKIEIVDNRLNYAYANLNKISINFVENKLKNNINEILENFSYMFYNSKKICNNDINNICENQTYSQFLSNRLKLILNEDDLKNDDIIPNINSFIGLKTFIKINIDNIDDNILLSIDNSGFAIIQKTSDNTYFHAKFLDKDKVHYNILVRKHNIFDTSIDNLIADIIKDESIEKFKRNLEEYNII